MVFQENGDGSKDTYLCTYSTPIWSVACQSADILPDTKTWQRSECVAPQRTL